MQRKIGLQVMLPSEELAVNKMLDILSVNLNLFMALEEKILKELDDRGYWESQGSPVAAYELQSVRLVLRRKPEEKKS